MAESEEGTSTEASEGQGGESSNQDSRMSAHRQWLVESDRKASEAYDKAIMTLSGGALGVSFAFVKDIVHSPDPRTLWALVGGWGGLIVSLVAILISMLTSRWALRRAINQVDEGTIHSQAPGGWYSRLTSLLNVAAGLGFVLGVVFLGWFAVANLTQLGEPMKSNEHVTQPSKPTPTPKPVPKPAPTPKREGYEPPPPPPRPQPKK